MIKDIVWILVRKQNFPELYFSETVFGQKEAKKLAEKAAIVMKGKAIRCALTELKNE